MKKIILIVSLCVLTPMCVAGNESSCGEQGSAYSKDLVSQICSMAFFYSSLCAIFVVKECFSFIQKHPKKTIGIPAALFLGGWLGNRIKPNRYWPTPGNILNGIGQTTGWVLKKVLDHVFSQDKNDE